jgi:arginine decarboxylase
MAYSSKVSQIPGDIITASIAVGIPKDDTKPGVIMEYSASSHKEEAEEIVKNMVCRSNET